MCAELFSGTTLLMWSENRQTNPLGSVWAACLDNKNTKRVNVVLPGWVDLFAALKSMTDRKQEGELCLYFSFLMQHHSIHYKVQMEFYMTSAMRDMLTKAKPNE